MLRVYNDLTPYYGFYQRSERDKKFVIKVVSNLMTVRRRKARSNICVLFVARICET